MDEEQLRRDLALINAAREQMLAVGIPIQKSGVTVSMVSRGVALGIDQDPKVLAISSNAIRQVSVSPAKQSRCSRSMYRLKRR